PRPTAPLAATGVRQASRRAGPNCRRRSPAIFPIAGEIGQQLLQPVSGDRPTWRQRLKRLLCRCEPTLADAAFDKALMPVPGLQRHDLGDGAAAIGDDNGLASCASRTYSLSLFLRIFSPTLRIDTQVASGSFFVNQACCRHYFCHIHIVLLISQY